MKKAAFPYDSLPDLNELPDFLKNNKRANANFSHPLLNMISADQLIERYSEVFPDTYGADRIFIDYFITDAMQSDFPLIARDFYIHEFANFPNYEDVLSPDINNYSEPPEQMFIRLTLALMVNALHSGSEYTKALFLYLYKTYYKQEYKTLKRFRSISRDELLSLSDSEDRDASFIGNMARILFIARLLGIEINADCHVVYVLFSSISNWLANKDRFSLDEVTGGPYKECLREIEENFDSKKLYSLNRKMARYLGNVLKWLGYSPDFTIMCDDNGRGINGNLGITLSILKKTFPNREFSAEELTVYAAILHCASALACNTDRLEEVLEMLFYGEAGTYYYDDYPPLFHPNEVVAANAVKPGKPQKACQPKKPEPKIEHENTQYSENVLLDEINMLRRKVHKLESDNYSLRAEIADRKRKDEEIKAVRQQLEAANSELVSLRDYVYNLTEEDSPIQEEDINSMKEAIAKLRIVIVGGHANWRAKMKREFPNWTFIRPDASGSTDASIVDKADHVYFFTDTISHSRYYQFLNVVREKKVDFGYIHGVNIEKNIRDIYRDVNDY